MINVIPTMGNKNVIQGLNSTVEVYFCLFHSCCWLELWSVDTCRWVQSLTGGVFKALPPGRRRPQWPCATCAVTHGQFFFFFNKQWENSPCGRFGCRFSAPGLWIVHVGQQFRLLELSHFYTHTCHVELIHSPTLVNKQSALWNCVPARGEKYLKYLKVFFF